MPHGTKNPEPTTGNPALAVPPQDHASQAVPTSLPPPQPNAANSQPSPPPVPAQEATHDPPAMNQPAETLAFIVNLTVLVATGTWLCVWLLYYTDNFDDFAKVLALGGGLTWLAFVLKLLPDERLKALQGDLDRLVFSRWWLTVVLMVAFAVGLYCRAHFGTLQVELFQGNEERVLTVKRAGVPLDPWRLMPGDKVRIPAWTSSSMPTLLYAKVSGYPDLRVRIAPHERRALRIPAAFTRRVILLKPTPGLIAARTSDLRIRVRLNGKVLSGEDGKPVGDLRFDGRPVWIGADEDVFIPQSMLERWRDGLPESVRTEVMGFLQHAAAISTSGFDLNSGDRVCVEFLRRNDAVYFRRLINVRPMEPNHDFPQEEEIDVPTGQANPPNC